MKSASKHTSKLTKGERLGWAPVKSKKNVRLTRDMVKSRNVNVTGAVSHTVSSSRNLLVP